MLLFQFQKDGRYDIESQTNLKHGLKEEKYDCPQNTAKL